MQAVSIRPATPADRLALSALEHRHFPAKPGGHHAGYLYDDAEHGGLALREDFQTRTRMLVSVAEFEESVVGFAAAAPFPIPGTSRPDDSNMLLQFVAVDEQHRRLGIGRALIEHLFDRIHPYRQTMIVAHIPSSQSDFYRSTGWHVLEPHAGFAWLPFNAMIRADFPDSAIGYERVAAYALMPKRVRRSFAFPSRTERPIWDSLWVLDALIRQGDLDMRDLDPETTEILEGHRRFAR